MVVRFHMHLFFSLVSFLYYYYVHILYLSWWFCFHYNSPSFSSPLNCLFCQCTYFIRLFLMYICLQFIFLFFCSTKKIEKGETPCKVKSHTRISLLFVACKNLTDLKVFRPLSFSSRSIWCNLKLTNDDWNWSV
jgi:hypothetical protein